MNGSVPARLPSCVLGACELMLQASTDRRRWMSPRNGATGGPLVDTRRVWRRQGVLESVERSSLRSHGTPTAADSRARRPRGHGAGGQGRRASPTKRSRSGTRRSDPLVVHAKMLRLELLNVEGRSRARARGFSLNCSKCGLNVHRVSGPGTTPGHWAHGEPAPHGEPAV